MTLDEYTDQQLMDELLNRRFEKELGHADIEYCENCKRFKPWGKKGEVPSNYNPCSAGHKMAFRMPEDWEGPHGEFGYYRRVCGDRVETPQPENCGNCHKCYKGVRLMPGWRPTLNRMLLCPDCGNKRCPKASDHDLLCTGSNAPGQPGSVYP